MSSETTWWTNCQTCGIGVTISAGNGGRTLTDPDDADEFLVCPYDGTSLTGWNED